MSSRIAASSTTTLATNSLAPLLATPSVMRTRARQAWRGPQQKKFKRRFLGSKDFQKALPIRRARRTLLQTFHQRLRFARTRFDCFKALEELFYLLLDCFQIASDRFKLLAGRLSHDARYPL
jgi:hypothetical protein